MVKSKMPEFERKVLEVLREPLESGHITISRAARQATFPARFQLIAAMNPCPCGYYGHYNNRCRCSPEQIARYRHKISGPLLDRMDMTIDVPALRAEELQHHSNGENSAQIQSRVEAARSLQLARQGKPNAALGSLEINHYCRPNETGQALLMAAVHKFNLSARAYHRILKVARSIADLEQSTDLQEQHLAEALQYRRMDY